MKLKNYIPLGLLAALLASFGIVADKVSEGETLGFDNAVLLALGVPGDPATPIGPTWLPEAARDVTTLGSFSVLTILVVGVVAFLVLIGKRGTAAFLTASVQGGTTVTWYALDFYDGPRRPSHGSRNARRRSTTTPTSLRPPGREPQFQR